MEINKIIKSEIIIYSLFSFSIFLWSIQFFDLSGSLFSFKVNTVVVSKLLQDLMDKKNSITNSYEPEEGSKSFLIQFRFIYLLLIFPIIYKFIFLKKIYNLKQLSYFLFFILLLFVINYKSIIYSPKLIASNLIVILTFIIVLQYSKYLKDVDKILGIFLFLFFLSLIFTGNILIPTGGTTDAATEYWDISRSFDNWTDKCGGIASKKIEFYIITGLEKLRELQLLGDNYVIPKTLSGIQNHSFKIGIAEFLFMENSHASIFGVPIFLYLIFKLQNTENKLSIFFIIFILLIFYIKSTTVFFLGIIASFIFIFIFNRKKFNKKITLIYFLLIFVLSYNFVSDPSCKKRYIGIGAFTKLISINIGLKDYRQSTQGNKSEKLIDNSNDTLMNLKHPHDKKAHKDSASLSSAVLLKSIDVAFKSIKDKPFGWGINNYQEAFNNYNNISNLWEKHPKLFNSYFMYQFDLNTRDASSTLIKMIVELGLFSFIIFSLILAYVISKRIPIEEKLFFVSLIITQFIRGVGYFNSGFLIVLMFLIIRGAPEMNYLFKKIQNHLKKRVS